MYSGGVKNTEVRGTRRRKRTWGATVPKLYAKTDGLKGNRSEKTAIPYLKHTVNRADKIKKE
jgi:hypothetical protein